MRVDGDGSESRWWRFWLTQDSKVVTNRSRVLGVIGVADTMDMVRDIVYKAVDKINFDGKQYRKDIGEIALG